MSASNSKLNAFSKIVNQVQKANILLSKKLGDKDL
jgi:hypothetical protein